jgi:hypothetical protein
MAIIYFPLARAAAFATCRNFQYRLNLLLLRSTCLIAVRASGCYFATELKAAYRLV